MIAEINPVLAMWLYAMAGVALLIATVVIFALVNHARHERYLQQLQEEADRRYKNVR